MAILLRASQPCSGQEKPELQKVKGYVLAGSVFFRDAFLFFLNNQMVTPNSIHLDNIMLHQHL